MCLTVGYIYSCKYTFKKITLKYFLKKKKKKKKAQNE